MAPLQLIGKQQCTSAYININASCHPEVMHRLRRRSSSLHTLQNIMISSRIHNRGRSSPGVASRPRRTRIMRVFQVAVTASLAWLAVLHEHRTIVCDAFPRSTIQSKERSIRDAVTGLDMAATAGRRARRRRQDDRERRRNLVPSSSSSTRTMTTASFPLTRSTVAIRSSSLFFMRERTDEEQDVESLVESDQHTASSLKKLVEQASPTLQTVAATAHEKESAIHRIRSTRSLLALTVLTLFGGCIAGAVLDILPGYWTVDPQQHTTLLNVASLGRDLGSSILIGALAYGFVQANTYAVSVDRLQPRDARKLIHTCSAPLYLLFWPLFSAAPGARVFCAVIPVLNALRLFLAATANGGGDSSSTTGEQDLAATVSRTGNVREALGGPFIYVCIMALATLLFWRDSPVGVTALSILAAGDGMADLVGRRLGKNNKWPHNPDKSMAGSLAFVVAGSVTATALLAWLQYAGCLVLPFGMPQVALTVVAIALVSAAMEVVPASWLWGIDDNYTVPLSAALLSYLWLR